MVSKTTMENAAKCFSGWQHLFSSSSSEIRQQMVEVFYISRIGNYKGSGRIVVNFPSPSGQINDSISIQVNTPSIMLYLVHESADAIIPPSSLMLNDLCR
jgi:hypothetical protein